MLFFEGVLVSEGLWAKARGAEVVGSLGRYIGGGASGIGPLLILGGADAIEKDKRQIEALPGRDTSLTRRL